MRLMGLETLYCRPETTVTGRDHKVYPYLLRNVPITRPNQVWRADTTYLPMPSGLMYLAATIDWFSRFVVSWKLSSTLDGASCQEMPEESLQRGTPEVFNTDRGVQFTAHAWTGRLEGAGVAVSMGGKGRCLDNIFVERLWRTVKYEEVYLKAYDSVGEARASLSRYLAFYNQRRPHSSLGGRTPDEAYFGSAPMAEAA